MIAKPVPTNRDRREHTAFRAVLDAMARPGRVRWLADIGQAEGGAWAGAIRVLEALVDRDVTFGFVGRDDRAHELLLRGTGARHVPVREAAFVLASGQDAFAAVRQARIGQLDRPELGATVVIACEAVGSGPLAIDVRGPGVEQRTMLALSGVDPFTLDAFTQRNAAFPLGVDLVFAGSNGSVAALPRSSTIAVLATRGEEMRQWATRQ